MDAFAGFHPKYIYVTDESVAKHEQVKMTRKRNHMTRKSVALASQNNRAQQRTTFHINFCIVAQI